MRECNLCMRHRLKVVCKHVKDTFSRVPLHIRTWPARRANGEDPREFHWRWRHLIRHESQIAWNLLVKQPAQIIFRRCGTHMMDMASKLAGTKDADLKRGYTIPFFPSTLYLDHSSGCVKIGPPWIDNEITLEVAERKLVQLHVASRILQECSYLYDTYHQHLNERTTELVMHSIYALIAIRLKIIADKNNRLNDAYEVLIRDTGKPDDILRNLRNDAESLVECSKWVNTVRNEVLAHVDLEPGENNRTKKNIMNRIDVKWKRNPKYEDVIYPIYTDKLAQNDDRYRFLGSVLVSEHTIKAVDRIMRKPIKTPNGSTEIQLVDLAGWMEIQWQNMIAMRFKGSKMIFRNT